MKNTIMALVAVAILGFAGSAFAACGTGYTDFSSNYDITSVDTIPSIPFQGSKQVCADYNPGTGTAQGQYYVICTHHQSGDKTYGSSSDKQVLLQSASNGQTCPAAPSDINNSADFPPASWTTL